MSNDTIPALMDMENFDKCLELSAKMGNKRVNLIGGEPLIIPNIAEYLERVVEKKCFQEILIFSNGTYKYEVNEIINKYNKMIKIYILINCNSKEQIGDDLYSHLLNNLEYLYRNNISFDLGINIYRTGQEYGDFICLAKKYKKKKVRWALAAPNDCQDFRDHYCSMIETSISFLKEMYEASIKADIDCCSIPVCLLSDEQIKQIVMYSPEVFNQKICHPSIDVLPDLSVVRCFAMTGVPRKEVTCFSSEKEIYVHFIKHIDLKEGEHHKEMCNDCPVYKRYKRGCGCLRLNR